MSAERFAHVHELDVQWGEVDRMGHVNNVWYARWVESARVGYFAKVGVMDAATQTHAAADTNADWPATVGPIVARLAIDYRRAVNDPDRISVGVTTTRFGRSSATHRYAITSAAQRAVVAEAEVVWVMLDYARNETVPIPRALRERIVALEATVGRTVEGA